MCTKEVAWKAWDQTWPSKYKTDYPCIIDQGTNECSQPIADGQTSDGSPQVSDCLQIAANIAANGGKWQVYIGDQHQEVQYQTCAFGVRATQLKGNIYFTLGDQDIRDAIETSVQQFGKNGLVGAEGTFSCHGNTKKSEYVKWGLYYNPKFKRL